MQINTTISLIAEEPAIITSSSSTVSLTPFYDEEDVDIICDNDYLLHKYDDKPENKVVLVIEPNPDKQFSYFADLNWLFEVENIGDNEVGAKAKIQIDNIDLTENNGSFGMLLASLSLQNDNEYLIRVYDKNGYLVSFGLRSS